MADIVKKALTAKRESKHVEFKQGFDSNSGRAWCELIKDLAAIANSGGGIIVFGLNNFGNPTGEPSENIASLDPADIANKISKYTGLVDFEFEIRLLEKKGNTLVAFLIQPASIPLVFEKPGTYDIGGNEQRTAFSVGTVYFRHGAKSEPGTSEDIRQVIERQLEHIRKSWIKGVKKVVQAPPGTQIVTVQGLSQNPDSHD
jgi:predicted HTH transcriptional regulator